MQAEEIKPTPSNSNLDPDNLQHVGWENDSIDTDPEVIRTKRNSKITWIGRALLSISILAIWQALGPHLNPLALSSPLQAGKYIISVISDGSLFAAISVTLKEIVIGYLVGSLGGIIFGFAIASNELIAKMVDPLVIALYGLPKIALLPLFIVWFGIGLFPKVILAATLVFFVVFFSTLHGVREIDKDLIDAVRLLGASDAQLRRWVILPGSLPGIFLGLKLGGPQALLGAVVGEMLVSSQGIGYMIQYSASQLNTPGVYGGLVILGLLALSLDWVVEKGHSHLIKRRR